MVRYMNPPVIWCFPLWKALCRADGLNLQLQAINLRWRVELQYPTANVPGAIDVIWDADRETP